MLHGIGMASSIRIASTAPTTLRASQLHARDSKFFKHYNLLHNPHHPSKTRYIYCRSSSSWEPASPTNETTTIVAQPTKNNIFETLTSETMAESKTSEPTETRNQSSSTVKDLLLKLPMWVLGPLVLLTTGMIPTLWLPISSIFLGSNIASLLSLVGLDCIFNLGATLFLLMADSCARPSNLGKPCNSKAPFSYRFWNLLASVTGFVVPTLMFLGSQRGLFQPQLPSIGFLVLLGPYFLLLSVQMLTEMLTWHWQSPVWLVTPVVYEAYRVLQLMRGLKLGAEMTAPAWVMNTIRVLVCWWVLILGVQLMRVAWFAGFSARKQEEESTSIAVSSD